jgi:hypothetical protein
LTRVEKDFACDTFMPALDPAQYRLWSATPPRRDNGVRTAFLCYTRTGAPPPRLPKALASRHDELQVRSIIASSDFSLCSAFVRALFNYVVEVLRPIRNICAHARMQCCPIN